MKFVLAGLSCLWCLSAPALADHNLRHRQLPDDTAATYVSHHVKITATNLAPAEGTCQAPVWVGIHDGRFDMMNQGSRASEAMEQLAEDGDATRLSQQFAITRGTLWDGTVGDGKLCSGDTAILEADIMVPVGAPYFVSYATMVLPSNDAFLANASPRAYKVINMNGKSLTPVTVVALGSDVWDAGTERNDEIPTNTAGLAQTVPNTGVPQWDAIRPHPGFMAVGKGGILDTPGYSQADFTQTGYEMMKLSVEIYEKKSAVHRPMMMMDP